MKDVHFSPILSYSYSYFRTIDENLQKHISILTKLEPRRLTARLQGKVKNVLRILVETSTKLESYIESLK